RSVTPPDPAPIALAKLRSSFGVIGEDPRLRMCTSPLGFRMGRGGVADRAAGRLPAGAGEHADGLVADRLCVGVEVEQDARPDTLVLAHDPEQDVLRPYVVVTERHRFAE